MGGSGTNAQNVTNAANPGLGAQLAQSTAQNNPGVQSLLSKYGQGQMSLSDALDAAKGMQFSDPNAQARQDLQNKANMYNQYASTGENVDDNKRLAQQAQDQLSALGPAPDQDAARAQIGQLLATDPLSGERYAEDQVQNGALTKGLFGQGGLQDKILGRMDDDRNAVSGRDPSYGLTEQDLTAYGQTSGNLARMFGQAEQNASQSLADRGLSSAPSGAAGALFSGIQGNKNEQLAQAQQQIAQNRINTARGLAEFRQNSDNQMAQSLGQLGQGALSNQFNRNMAGRQQNAGQLDQANQLNLKNTDEQQNQLNEQLSQQQATKPLGLGDIVGGFAGNLAASTGKSLGQGLGSLVAG